MPVIKHKFVVNLLLVNLLRNLMADYNISINLYDEDDNLLDYDLSFSSFDNKFSEWNKLTLIKPNDRTVYLAEGENVIMTITYFYRDGDDSYTESITDEQITEYGLPTYW